MQLSLKGLANLCFLVRKTFKLKMCDKLWDTEELQQIHLLKLQICIAVNTVLSVKEAYP